MFTVRGDWSLADRPPEQGGCVLLLEPRHRRHVPGREVIVPPSGDTLGLTPRKPNPSEEKQIYDLLGALLASVKPTHHGRGWLQRLTI